MMELDREQRKTLNEMLGLFKQDPCNRSYGFRMKHGELDFWDAWNKCRSVAWKCWALLNASEQELFSHRCGVARRILAGVSAMEGPCRSEEGTCKYWLDGEKCAIGQGLPDGLAQEANSSFMVYRLSTSSPEIADALGVVVANGYEDEWVSALFAVQNAHDRWSPWLDTGSFGQYMKAAVELRLGPWLKEENNAD
jgi:hypothetical protein